jgi:hypothetical protein
MRAFIHSEKGIPITINGYQAMRGFEMMGAEIILFESTQELLDQITRDDVVVGYISNAIYTLRKFGIPDPPLVDYPKELTSFLGRKIWKDKMSTILTTPEMYPVFVKSYDQKKTTGRLVKSFKDLIGAGYTREDFDVWCSEPLELVSEWRCFVRYDQIIDMRPYTGQWGICPDKGIIEAALACWKTDRPAGCSMDFGVTKSGQTVLIECNDGFALGQYGLAEHKYVKLITARWFQLVGNIDPYCTIDA